VNRVPVLPYPLRHAPSRDRSVRPRKSLEPAVPGSPPQDRKTRASGLPNRSRQTQHRGDDPAVACYCRPGLECVHPTDTPIRHSLPTVLGKRSRPPLLSVEQCRLSVAPPGLWGRRPWTPSSCLCPKSPIRSRRLRSGRSLTGGPQPGGAHIVRVRDGPTQAGSGRATQLTPSRVPVRHLGALHRLDNTWWAHLWSGE